jgi:hypothetical protein
MADLMMVMPMSVAMPMTVTMSVVMAMMPVIMTAMIVVMVMPGMGFASRSDGRGGVMSHEGSFRRCCVAQMSHRSKICER